MPTRKTLGLVVVLLLIVIAGGLYVALHPAAAPLSYNIIETGDRQHREDTDYYTIQIDYPDKTPLATRGGWGAEGRAEATINSTLNALVKQFKAAGSVDSMSQDEKDRLTAANLKYSLNIGYHAYSSGAFVSYEFDVFMDTGGAHPNNLYKTLVFDLNGNQVALGDLFVSGSDYLTRISQEAQTQVKEELIQRAGADAADTIMADGVAPKAENFEDFVIDSDHITILIPPYQAAAYAAGAFQVMVPLSDLKDILKPNVQ